MDKILEGHLEFVRQQYEYALHTFCLYKYLKESTYGVRQGDIVAERNADIRNSHGWILGSFTQSYYLELSIIYLGSLFVSISTPSRKEDEFGIKHLIEYIKDNLDEINRVTIIPITKDEIDGWEKSELNYHSGQVGMDADIFFEKWFVNPVSKSPTGLFSKEKPIKEWRDRIAHNFIEKRLNKMNKLESLNELKDIEAEFKKIEEFINSILGKFEQGFYFEEYKYQVSKDYDALFDSLRKEKEIQSLFWDYSLTDESRFKKIKELYTRE